MKHAAESFHPFALSQLFVDRTRARTHGAQFRNSTVVVPRGGLSKRPFVGKPLVIGEACDLTDADVGSDLLGMPISINRPEFGPPGVRQQDDFVLAETLPNEIDHLVEITLELCDGH